MYYRDYRGGFLLPFLAGAVISPLFLGAFNGGGYNNCINGYCPNQGYPPYQINQQFGMPYYPQYYPYM